MRSTLVVVIAIASGCGPGPQPAPAEPAPLQVAPAPPAADPGGAGAIRVAPPPATYEVRHTRPAIALPPVDRTGPLFAAPAPAASAVAPRSPALQPAAPVPDGQIKALRKLADATADTDPEKPELLLRLGEALATRDRHRQEAITAFVALVDNPRFTAYPRMDQALFQLGNLLAGAKRMPEARVVYLRLIKDYPASMVTPDVYLVFADHYFEQAQMVEAAQFYDKVLQFPKARVYPYALYKRGWVHGNQARWREALELFYKTAQVAGPAEWQLAAAARSGLVRAYAELGKPDAARTMFARVSVKDADAMLEQLVDLYEQSGKLPQAMVGYRLLIGARPQDARVCDWQLGVVRVARLGASATERVNEVIRLADVADQVKTPACQETARSVLVALGRMTHDEAHKTLNRDTFPLAERLYARYLMSFATAPEATQIRHDRAELLWQIAQLDNTVLGGRAKWPPVAGAFDELAADPGATAELRAAAAEAARLARENLAAIP